MTWNYRVIEFVTPGGEPWRAIHEVHYDVAGCPTSYAENPAAVVWDAEMSDAEAVGTLTLMALSLGKPRLVEADFMAAPVAEDGDG